MEKKRIRFIKSGGSYGFIVRFIKSVWVVWACKKTYGLYGLVKGCGSYGV